MAAKKSKPLKNLRIMVTNDDGVGAPGMRILEKIAKSLSDDVWVVAPEREQSGAGHSLTLTEPLRMRKVSARKYAVLGTPTDCVMLGVNQLFQEHKPDLLLSGINRGANMGEDVTYSGTIAACMEGTLIGIPSIAMSQSFANRRTLHWPTAEAHAAGIIRKLVKEGWPNDVLMNVNFPDVPKNEVKGFEIVPQGRRDYSNLQIVQRIDARDQPYYWIGFRPVQGKPKRNSDIGAVEAGYIAVTPLHLNLTETKTLRALRRALKK